MRRLIFFFLMLFCAFLKSEALDKRHYVFAREPIDVVITCIEKDLKTLNLCIESIRTYCQGVRRIIVVSPKLLTDKAEWFDEKLFPFSFADVSYYLNGQDQNRSREFLSKPGSRCGWYYQQLLKLYAGFVIPDISSNVLIVDADVVFLRPISFLNEQGGGLYTSGSECHKPYFVHAKELIPGFQKVYPNLSGVAHHMLFQRPVLIDLFEVVESAHQMDFWKAFCFFVNPSDLNRSGASEYEIYFNFVLLRTDQVSLRPLKWKNAKDLKNLGDYKKRKYDYVAFHEYLTSSKK